MAEFRFGEGKISGALSVTLGTLGFGAVLCLCTRACLLRQTCARSTRWIWFAR